MTTSTEVMVTTLRTRLLDFQALGSPTPSTLSSVLQGQGIYYVQGPAKVSAATFPYAIMLLGTRERAGEYMGEREQVELELQFFGRPRSEQYTIEGYADVADQALLRYEDTSSGVMFSGASRRDTLPVFPPPADREVVAVRCVYDLVVWPVFLTQY